MDADIIRVYEKLDGANFRFMLREHLDDEYQDGAPLVFGSRNVTYKNERDIDNNFEHAIDYVLDQVDVDELRAWEDEFGPLIVYGEAMHPHTLEYDWDEVPSFLGFDVWIVDEGNFMPGWKTLLGELNLPTVPHLENIEPEALQGGEQPYDVPDSMYRDGVAEGVVFKDYESGTFAKLRSEEFRETFEKKHADAGAAGHTPSDEVQFMNQFVTPRRIEKEALRLRNEADYDGIKMEMMEDIPWNVLVDVFEEEAHEIVGSNWELDMGKLRSDVSGRCADVLQDVIQTRGMNELAPDEYATHEDDG